MFLVVFRFSWCNYSLIILYDGKSELESIFGGKLFNGMKLQWLTNSIGVDCSFYMMFRLCNNRHWNLSATAWRTVCCYQY